MCTASLTFTYSTFCPHSVFYVFTARYGRKPHTHTHTHTHSRRAVPRFGRLIACFSTRRLEFFFRSGQVGFVVDKWHWDRFFCQYFTFSVSLSFHQCSILMKFVVYSMHCGQPFENSLQQNAQYSVLNIYIAVKHNTLCCNLNIYIAVKHNSLCCNLNIYIALQHNSLCCN